MNDDKDKNSETRNSTDSEEYMNNCKNKNIDISLNTENNHFESIKKEKGLNINEENDDKIIDKTKNENINDFSSIHIERSIAEDSYNNDFNNSFCVFESINQILYLIYTNENFSIITYNLVKFQKINEIKKAHRSSIIGFRHYSDKKNKRDLIISISIKDNNVKLWNINDFELLFDYQKINNNGFINSACFLSNNSDIYIVSSNFNFMAYTEPIKVFDLNGKLVQILDTFNEIIFFLDVYYDKILSMSFIISCGYESVQSYDFNGGIIYNQYFEEEKYRYNSALINDSENEIKLIAPNTIGYIVIWNFHSGELINKIKAAKDILYDICQWDNNSFIIGGDYELKIINIKNKEIIRELINTKRLIRTIKKFTHTYFGECLIVQDKGKGKLNIWTLNHSNL